MHYDLVGQRFSVRSQIGDGSKLAAPNRHDALYLVNFKRCLHGGQVRQSAEC